MSRAVAYDLRATRDHLVRYGWRQGNAYDDNDPSSTCCIVGAASRALGDAPPFRHGMLRAALHRATPEPFDVSDWNDAPGRTFAEVLALLDKAIAAEEARL